MSIIDKLPEAPEGYKWETSISVTNDDTRVYVRLERDYGGQGIPPKVPESSSVMYQFCAPNEDSVIGSARLIREKFDKSASLRDYLNARTAEAHKVYAELLTN